MPTLAIDRIARKTFLDLGQQTVERNAAHGHDTQAHRYGPRPRALHARTARAESGAISRLSTRERFAVGVGAGGGRRIRGQDHPSAACRDPGTGVATAVLREWIVGAAERSGSPDRVRLL